MIKNIIVNADDFGSRPSVNKAIVELFDSNVINSTTLMANMPGFEEAVDLAHRHNIIDKIGVHLVLTAGVPLTPEMSDITYLFNEENISRNVLLKKLFILTKHQKSVIFNEYSKQIEKVKQQRIPVTHLDTHQHMHDMWGIMQVILELLKIYKIPSVRILNNLNVTGYHKFAYRNLVNGYLKYKKINFTDYFGSRVDFISVMEKNPGIAKNKTVEIMVHPDYNSYGKLVDIYPETAYDFDFLKVLR